MGHADTHRLLHDYFNSRDFAEVERLLAPGFMYEDLPQGLTFKTSGEFMDWLRGWSVSFSDGMISTPAYDDGPDFSIARYHGRGTNDGPLGPLPATGRTADIPFCEVLHYASDGTVLSGEIYYDQLSLLTQLGHLTPPGEAVADTLEPVVRELFSAFDALDAAAIDQLCTDDTQGVDEIARHWLRGRDAMNQYLAGLEGAISGIRSEISDLRESITGDSGTVTLWLEQDYTMDGQTVHVSAPTTIGLRRVGPDWKVCLVHSIPLAAES